MKSVTLSAFLNLNESGLGVIIDNAFWSIALKAKLKNNYKKKMYFLNNNKYNKKVFTNRF